MSKLNLDLFGDGATPEDGPKAENAEARVSKAAPAGKEKADSKQLVESPKFVPVGFDRESLYLLDEAVLGLRREGYWKASKSAIVRRLIWHHRSDLDQVFKQHEGKSP